jgi:hypothetical protein
MILRWFKVTLKTENSVISQIFLLQQQTQCYLNEQEKSLRHNFNDAKKKMSKDDRWRTLESQITTTSRGV